VAGTVQVAGRSPLRFISRECGDVELVECVCGQRADAEERGVAGLLRGDQLNAGAPKVDADDADKKPDVTKVVGEQDPWLVAKELLQLGAGMFLSRVSWVVIKVSGGNMGKVWQVRLWTNECIQRTKVSILPLFSIHSTTRDLAGHRFRATRAREHRSVGRGVGRRPVDEQHRRPAPWGRAGHICRKLHRSRQQETSRSVE